MIMFSLSLDFTLWSFSSSDAISEENLETEQDIEIEDKYEENKNHGRKKENRDKNSM